MQQIPRNSVVKHSITSDPILAARNTKKHGSYGPFSIIAIDSLSLQTQNSKERDESSAGWKIVLKSLEREKCLDHCATFFASKQTVFPKIRYQRAMLFIWTNQSRRKVLIVYFWIIG